LAADIIAGRPVGEIEVRPEPDRTSSPRGCRYRYYVSQALLHQRKEDAGSLPRLPAHDFEALISGRIVEVLGADARLKAALVKVGYAEHSKVGYAAHSNEEMSVNHDRRGRHAFFRRHPGFVAGCCAIGDHAGARSERRQHDQNFELSY
jgi:hypothetical protein